jgi:hypothetical protein
LLSKNTKNKMERTIVLPVSYGCKTGSLREEHRLRVFKNRVMRKIHRPRRENVIGAWRE